jgi:RNA polymerase sigma factor (sigma-70 family)
MSAPFVEHRAGHQEDALRARNLRGEVLRKYEVGCDNPPTPRPFNHMAVTETGHLAAREIDDLYRAHVGEVYRYAYAVLGNHADAEDVTQTTFLNAYRALEQGVKPRKPTNWLLTIASNAIKQRFRQEQSRPRYVELDERIAHAGAEEDDDDGPSVGELLTALSKIPPQQRQAIVLREFEGRSYSEIAEILGITTSALETLLFRARRSLAEELEHQLTCTEAQLAISRSVDDRLGRKERRRLRDHLAECPDCARFARLQQRHRSALRGLALVPIPVSLTLFKGFEGTASAATSQIAVGAAGAGAASAAAVSAGVGVGGTATATGGVLAGGLGLKAAAVVAAAGVAGGVGVAGSSEVDKKAPAAKRPAALEQPGTRLGQVAPRGVSVPGNGVARGKLSAPGQQQAKRTETEARGNSGVTTTKAKQEPRGQAVSAAKRQAAQERKGARVTQTPPRATKAPGTGKKTNTRKPQKPLASTKKPEKAKAEARAQPGTRAHGAAEKKAAATTTETPETPETPAPTTPEAPQPEVEHGQGPKPDKAGGPKD